MDLTKLSVLTNLKTLNLTSVSNAKDETLSTLSTLVNMETFHVDNREVSDKTVENVISCWPKLRSLSLASQGTFLLFLLFIV
jgi:hypothetical protein